MCGSGTMNEDMGVSTDASNVAAVAGFSGLDNPVSQERNFADRVVNEGGTSNMMDNLTTMGVNAGIGYATDGLANIDTVDTLAGTKENPNYWNTAGNSAKGYFMSNANGGAGDGGTGDGGGGEYGYSRDYSNYNNGNIGSGSGDYSIGDTNGGGVGGGANNTGSGYYGGTDAGSTGGGMGGGWNSLDPQQTAWDSPSLSSNATAAPTTTPTINATPNSTTNSWMDALSGGAKTGAKYISAAQGIYQMMNAQQAKKSSQQAQQQAQAERAPYVQQLQALMANPGQVLPNTPGYQAGLQAVQRAQAAQGYQGSGNMMAALQQYGGNAYNQQASMLSQLAGRPYDPNGANALARDEYTQNMTNNGLWNIGASFGNPRPDSKNGKSND